jgi:PAS domain S-box-containing protein
MGQTIDEIISPGSFEVAISTFNNALADQNQEGQKCLNKSNVLELELNCKNGSTIWTENKATLLHNEAGQPLGIIGITSDISERKRVEEEREGLIGKLQDALDNIKTLKGLLPICSKCKKIRDDKGYWNQIEGYIQEHSDALFSHSLCPECMNKIYGDEDWYTKEDDEK